jgi:glycerol kinase
MMLTSIDNPFSYDSRILKFFGIHDYLLPPIKNNLDDFGMVKGIGSPIRCSIGDQHSSFLGNFYFTRGWNCKCKLTIGTGSFFITSDSKACDRSIRTIGYSKSSHCEKVYELPMLVGGCTIDWFSSLFKYEGDFNINDLDSNGLFVFPGLSGHLFPIWNDYPSSIIVGIKDGHTMENYFSAIIECIGFEISNSLEALNLITLRIDGGLSNIKPLLQIIADCLKIELIIDEVSSESTSYGAALFSSGLNYDDSNLSFISPNLSASKHERCFKTWKYLKEKLFGLLSEFNHENFN